MQGRGNKSRGSSLARAEAPDPTRKSEPTVTRVCVKTGRCLVPPSGQRAEQPLFTQYLPLSLEDAQLVGV